ncbi:MAG: chemotaxis protein CheD [Planctomycetes bacterium]|nr:chemotaxis protein CheD [Planctomycetota bacterium]
MPINVANSNVVTVGVGDYKIVRAPKLLKTLLGSCIGVALYDSTTKIGGLLHIMLPKRENNATQKASKYADSGISVMIDHMVNNAGACRASLTAKVFGGACMFLVGNPLFDIGRRNEDEVRRVLQEEDIRILAHRTGGNKGYQILFDTNTGKITCCIFGEAPEEY